MSALSCLNTILSSTNFLLKNHTIEKKYLEYFQWAYGQFRALTALAEELIFDSRAPMQGSSQLPLTTYSTRRLKGRFWAPQTSVFMCTCSHRHTYMHIHTYAHNWEIKLLSFGALCWATFKAIFGYLWPMNHVLDMPECFLELDSNP